MEAILAFLLAFVVSFVGSIPPATINLSVVQLGLDNKTNIAGRLALAAALTEYPYAWLAVKFQDLITSAPMVVENFKLITAIVMITLGALNLWSANKPSRFSEKINNSGFRRGFILGILNPLALPFWIGFTLYFKEQHWIELSTPLALHSYLFGVSLGAFALLLLLAHFAKKIGVKFQHSMWIKKIPGFVMLALGVYAMFQYLL
jgi:threonine/homoserine/homoserine lactone efflux protein